MPRSFASRRTEGSISPGSSSPRARPAMICRRSCSYRGRASALSTVIITSVPLSHIILVDIEQYNIVMTDRQQRSHPHAMHSCPTNTSDNQAAHEQEENRHGNRRMPPQGYSKGTLALATAARNVAETAIPRAFKNGVVPTVPRSETVAITPFSKHWNQCLLTLNLNSTISPSCIT